MAPSPSSSDGEPDFSFLGDHSVPDGTSAPDLGGTEGASEVPDFSSFGDVSEKTDVSAPPDEPVAEAASADVSKSSDANDGPSIPDDTSVPDVSDTEGASEVPDFSNFGDVTETPDFSAPPDGDVPQIESSEASEPPVPNDHSPLPNAESAPDSAGPASTSELPDFSNFGGVTGTPDFSALPDEDVPDAMSVKISETSAANENATEPTVEPKKSLRKLQRKSKTAPADVSKKEQASGGQAEAVGDTDAASVVQNELPVVEGVPKKTFSIVAGYAAAMTLLLLGLLLTGRISLSGGGVLESLPDVKPLQSNEFKKVPDDAALPEGHSLNLGESRRFGDIVITPFKVTREKLTFINMMNGAVADGKVTKPVLKLWFRMENKSPDIAFPPWDVDLMCHRSEKNESAVANSWLMVQEAGADKETQILNFYHSPESNLDLADHHSRELLNPGSEVTSFIASSEAISQIAQDTIEGYRWRIQFRKGVHFATGNGVTTLVDVMFSPEDVGA